MMRRTPRGHRPARAIGAAAALGLGLSLLGGVASADVGDVEDGLTPATGTAQGTEENLGEPILGLTNAGAGYTQDADGRHIGLVIAGGSPSQFSAVDIVTGELLTTEVIEGSTLTWAYATAPDRMVYIGTASGQIFAFDPDELTLEQIASQPFDETYFWDAGVNEDGTVFFGTYPGGKVLSYDPATDEWEDYGQQVPGNQYVRSIAVDGQSVYAGGMTTPALTHLDTGSGEITEIDLPEGYSDNEGVYDVDIAEDTLLARVTPANDVLVYDLEDQEWTDTISDAVGMSASPALATSDSGVERTEVLLPLVGGGMIGYDLDTAEQREVSLDLGGASARGWDIQEFDLEGFPGESVVTADSSARFYLWNPQTGETTSVASDAQGTPFQIRSLGSGPDGDVWAGGYASPPGVARVDAETGESEQLPMSGQVEGIIAHEDSVVFGTYPGAGLRTYDTTEPWDFGSNPGDSVSIEPGQDRPVGFASSGEEVVVGSVPDYGQLGGGLSVFDPDTGELDVIEEPIPDQTVLNLAYADGLYYGGTGIWGGLGIEPSTDEGRLFTFDAETHEVVDHGVPVPGEENISGLTFDDAGMLWGMTANVIFQVDPETMEVTGSEQYFDVDDSAAYWTTRDLFASDGMLVGMTAGELFEVDPQTWEMTILQSGVQNLAIDRLGNYYYNRGGTLYRWIPEDGGGECTETITGDHRGPVSLEEGTTCISQADIRGPVSVTDGASIVLTDSELRGPLRSDGADQVHISDSEITGPVQITSSSGGVELSGNTITGVLSCSGNDPGPVGGDNTVRGPASGQCAELAD